jgi:hypothetical protein
MDAECPKCHRKSTIEPKREVLLAHYEAICPHCGEPFGGELVENSPAKDAAEDQG